MATSSGWWDSKSLMYRGSLQYLPVLVFSVGHGASEAAQEKLSISFLSNLHNPTLRAHLLQNELEEERYRMTVLICRILKK